MGNRLFQDQGMNVLNLKSTQQPAKQKQTAEYNAGFKYRNRGKTRGGVA